MLVLMCAAVPWQHVGREVVLNVGESYELPDVVATALVAGGLAAHVTAADPAPAVTPQKRRSRRAR